MEAKAAYRKVHQDEWDVSARRRVDAAEQTLERKTKHRVPLRPSVDARFGRYEAEVRARTEFAASLHDVFFSDSYQKVIGLGPAALPGLL